MESCSTDRSEEADEQSYDESQEENINFNTTSEISFNTSISSVESEYSEQPTAETKRAIATCNRCRKQLYSDDFHVVNFGSDEEENIMNNPCKKCLKKKEMAVNTRSSIDSIIKKADFTTIHKNEDEEHPPSPSLYVISSCIIGLGSKTIIYGREELGPTVMDLVHSINSNGSTNFAFGIENKKTLSTLEDHFPKGILTLPIKLEISGVSSSTPISSTILVAIVINHQSNISALIYNPVDQSVTKSVNSLAAIIKEYFSTKNIRTNNEFSDEEMLSMGNAFMAYVRNPELKLLKNTKTATGNIFL
jgi:hypothetical protein